MDITLIRFAEWVEAPGAEVGGEIFLDLPHMGARGFARVIAINPCPSFPIKGADDPTMRLVTGTFRHSTAEVYDLKLAADSEPIGVTATHPFWSVDRGGWVPAGELRIGETLKTLTGTTHVESMEQRPHAEPVYNIEVEGDHVYRVGESGVLVHNSSAPDRAWPTCSKMPASGHARNYQIGACGPLEYEISGNGELKCADSVEGTVVVDCKALNTPESSPQLGTAPDFITDAAVAQWRKDLLTYQTMPPHQNLWVNSECAKQRFARAWQRLRQR